MTPRRTRALQIGTAGVLAVALALAGTRTATRSTMMAANCHTLEADLFDDVLADMQMVPSVLAPRPTRMLDLVIDLPLVPRPDDIFHITAGSDRDDVLFAGPFPDGGRFRLAFPLISVTGPEEYWMGFQLIRKDTRSFCVWSGEELFALPDPAQTRWRVELLDRPDDTGDGGTRWTRISPL